MAVSAVIRALEEAQERSFQCVDVDLRNADSESKAAVQPG